MRNGKIYWVKQKLVGLAFMIVPLFFMNALIETGAIICIPLYWILGYLIIREKSRITCMFRSDYIFDLKLFIKIVRRKIRKRRLRSGRL